jgi:hypothetical protein
MTHGQTNINCCRLCRIRKVSPKSLRLHGVVYIHDLTPTRNTLRETIIFPDKPSLIIPTKY